MPAPIGETCVRFISELSFQGTLKQRDDGVCTTVLSNKPLSTNCNFFAPLRGIQKSVDICDGLVNAARDSAQSKSFNNIVGIYG